MQTSKTHIVFTAAAAMAALFAAMPASATSISYVGSFGAPSGFDEPFGISISGGTLSAGEAFGSEIFQFNPSNYAGTLQTFSDGKPGAYDVVMNGGDIYASYMNGSHGIEQFDPSNLAGTAVNYTQSGFQPKFFAFHNGLVYATDEYGVIDVFDPNNFAGTFTTLGSNTPATGEFTTPNGIAFIGGTAWVADTGSIVSFDPNSFAGTFTRYGSYGSGVGQFQDPAGVAVGDGLIFVADSGNQRIDWFDPSNFVGTFGSYSNIGVGAGQLYSPAGVAIDGDKLYVSDSALNVIDEYQINGITGTPEPSAFVFGGIGAVAILAGKMRRRRV